MNEDETRFEMVVQLDQVLHGQSIARDATPEEVWFGLLTEVETLVHQAPPKQPTDRVLDTLITVLESIRSANR